MSTASGVNKVSRWLDRPWTLFKVGFADAIAYRGEFVVWILATNMPLIMLLLWSAVVAEAPVGRYGQREISAYFLTTLVVRLATGVWVVWDMNMDIRSGRLGMRLMRPMHPFWAYAFENFAAWPFRVAMGLPVAIVAVSVLGVGAFTHDARQVVLFPFTIFSAWMLNLAVMLGIGCLAFFWQSSMNVFEVWMRLYFVLSGYIVPLDLFPKGLLEATRFLPFRYLLAFPVETALGQITFAQSLLELGRQWSFIALFLAVALSLWRVGVRRYEAFGG